MLFKNFDWLQRLKNEIYILMPYSCPTCQLIRFMRLYSTFITLFANTRGVKCNFFKVFIDNKPYRFMLHFSIFVPLNIKKKDRSWSFLWFCQSFLSQTTTERNFSYWNLNNLTLYTLISICIFSILFSIHFLRCWQGEFAWQSRASVIVDHSHNSHDLNFWFRCDTVSRF